MKKIIISILTISFLILSGCYKGDDKVTVKINLGNMPVAKNMQPETFLDRLRSFFIKNAYAADPDLFIAALNGDTVLLNQSFYKSVIQSNNNTVELEVPAGDNITILVVTTNTSNKVNYYGDNTIDLQVGETTDVSINMEQITNWDITIPVSDCPALISWQSEVNANYLITDTDGYILYEGSMNQTTLDNYSNYLYVEFWPFNLMSLPIAFNVTGCG